MHVKLISYTKPTKLLQNDGIISLEDLIAYSARVSNPNNQTNTDTSESLLKYLIKHRHWSPFEMVNVCLEITSTRDIVRQILRHRSFTFQEFSQRYADPSESLGFVHRECRMQDLENRQNSIWCTDDETRKWWDTVQVDIIHDIEDVYNQALRRGIAKEVARAILPEGLTKSRIYMNGTIRSWIHYCSKEYGIRSGEETQKEHRDVALGCISAISEVFPKIGVKE